jgi:hypothetical protein
LALPKWIDPFDGAARIFNSRMLRSSEYKAAMKTHSNLKLLRIPHPNYTARIFALGLLIVLLLAALARVNGGETPKPAASPAGVYALLSVDGKTVPCTVNHDGTAMEVQSGSFTITTNKQCTSVMTFSVGDQKNIRRETRATYKLSGSELTMQWQGAGWTKGQVNGSTFAMTNEGMVFIYRK